MSVILSQTAHGPMLMPLRDPYMTVALAVNGAFSPAQFAGWQPYIPVGGVVIEVGANIGAHTLAFATHVGRDGAVVAFEPQWMPFAMACGTMALNGQTQVRIHRNAVGKHRGTATIPVHDFREPMNFGATRVSDEGEPVEMVALDDFTFDRCDFLKVDVEGMELDVLTGAKRLIHDCQPVIGVEAEKPEDQKRLAEFLRNRGYQVQRFLPPYGPQWPNQASFDLLAVPAGRTVFANPHLYPV